MSSTPPNARPDRFALWFFALAGLVFAGTGLAFVIAPGLVPAVRDAGGGASPDAINDARAVYGALELGFGIFLALCARRPSRHEAGFLAALVAGGAMAASRFAGFALVEGTPPAHLAYGALDAAGAAFALYGLRRNRATSPTSSSAPAESRGAST